MTGRTMWPKRPQVSGVVTHPRPVEPIGIQRVNDRIFTGPRAAVQRYLVGPNATEVLKPYGSANG